MKKFLLVIFLFFPVIISAAAITENLAGRILLQVELNGEAWYVNPENNSRYFLGRPVDAFRVMKNLGLGISNADLYKIPISLTSTDVNDFDNDGISDLLESALGLNLELRDSDRDGAGDKEEIENNTNAWGDGPMVIDQDLAARLSGRILLQVEKQGEAWYINPLDKKRYFLGRPSDAFALMQKLGLGISNNDLNSISAITPGFKKKEIERLLHEEINNARRDKGLKDLQWNDQLAQVARKHSESLMAENKNISGINRTCDFPVIHHEDIELGLYNSNRLRNDSIHYFSQTAENIALMSAAIYSIFYQSDDPRREKIENCDTLRDQIDADFKARLDQAEDKDKIALIKKEIIYREDMFAKQDYFEFSEPDWKSQNELAKDTTEGWMNSPGHRENILNGAYDETGIGAVFWGPYMIATQVFIKRADCGYYDGPCCVEDKYYYCYEPNRCSIDGSVCK